MSDVRLAKTPCRWARCPATDFEQAPGAAQAALPYGSLALFDFCGNSLSVSGHSTNTTRCSVGCVDRPRPAGSLSLMPRVTAKWALGGHPYSSCASTWASSRPACRRRCRRRLALGPPHRPLAAARRGRRHRRRHRSLSGALQRSLTAAAVTSIGGLATRRLHHRIVTTAARIWPLSSALCGGRLWSPPSSPPAGSTLERW